MTGVQLSESTLSQRRSALPRRVFEELLSLILRPMAKEEEDPGAFCGGRRLLGIDGTSFSLTNTPQNRRHAGKAKTRRGLAAFVKFHVVALVELGLHNPLAAALGYEGQSEWALAKSLIAQVPAGVLLLGDRLFGCPAFVSPLLERVQEIGSDFLIRVKDIGSVSAPKRKILKVLGDGSALVEITEVQNRRVVTRRKVREIIGWVQRPGCKSVRLRLWTSLLDPVDAPALELLELYARRWDHELYWKQIKLQLRKSEVLQSHTPHTASQEIAAIIILSSLLAEERGLAADGQVAAVRISFGLTLERMAALWMVLEAGGDLLSEEQKRGLCERLREQLRRCKLPLRRTRSCPRTIRQPQKVWPRTMVPQSHEGPVSFEVVAIADSPITERH